MNWWQDVVEKASRKLSPRASSWASGEQERHNADGHKSGGQYIAVFVQSPTSSHSKTLSNPFWTFQIKWEVYFFKEVFARHYYCAIMTLHAYVYIWIFIMLSIQQKEMFSLLFVINLTILVFIFLFLFFYKFK